MVIPPILERDPKLPEPEASTIPPVKITHRIGLGGGAILEQDIDGNFHLLEPDSKPVIAPNLHRDYETIS